MVECCCSILCFVQIRFFFFVVVVVGFNFSLIGVGELKCLDYYIFTIVFVIVLFDPIETGA